MKEQALKFLIYDISGKETLEISRRNLNPGNVDRNWNITMTTEMMSLQGCQRQQRVEAMCSALHQQRLK